MDGIDRLNQTMRAQRIRTRKNCGASTPTWPRSGYLVATDSVGTVRVERLGQAVITWVLVGRDDYPPEWQVVHSSHVDMWEGRVAAKKVNDTNSKVVGVVPCTPADDMLRTHTEIVFDIHVVDVTKTWLKRLAEREGCE